ncbi:MAG: SxtJ family membrane protein [Vicingaceae bacterium]
MKEIKDLKAQLVIVTGFLFLSWVFNVQALVYKALGLGLIFLLSPHLTRLVLWIWEKIAHVMGWINTRILLTLVFYIFLLPISLLFKLFNRDPLGMKWSDDRSTFFQRDHLYEASDLENPW